MNDPEPEEMQVCQLQTRIDELLRGCSDEPLASAIAEVQRLIGALGLRLRELEKDNRELRNSAKSNTSGGKQSEATQARLAEIVESSDDAIIGESSAEAALRDSEARHRAILDAAVDGIITIDERGTIEAANPAAGRLFGYAIPELIGANVKMLMPAPYHDNHDAYLDNYRRTGERKIIGIGREVVGRRKDGTVFPMDLAISEIGLGGRRMFTGLVHDVTERKQAEKELRGTHAQGVGAVFRRLPSLRTRSEAGRHGRERGSRRCGNNARRTGDRNRQRDCGALRRSGRPRPWVHGARHGTRA